MCDEHATTKPLPDALVKRLIRRGLCDPLTPASAAGDIDSCGRGRAASDLDEDLANESFASPHGHGSHGATTSGRRVGGLRGGATPLFANISPKSTGAASPFHHGSARCRWPVPSSRHAKRCEHMAASPYAATAVSTGHPVSPNGTVSAALSAQDDSRSTPKAAASGRHAAMLGRAASARRTPGMMGGTFPATPCPRSLLPPPGVTQAQMFADTLLRPFVA